MLPPSSSPGWNYQVNFWYTARFLYFPCVNYLFRFPSVRCSQIALFSPPAAPSAGSSGGAFGGPPGAGPLGRGWLFGSFRSTDFSKHVGSLRQSTCRPKSASRRQLATSYCYRLTRYPTYSYVPEILLVTLCSFIRKSEQLAACHFNAFASPSVLKSLIIPDRGPIP